MKPLLTYAHDNIAENGEEYFFAEGECGVRFGKDTSTIPATSFPAPSLTGCSFDETILEELGKALAEECLSDGIDVLLATDVNVKTGRDKGAYKLFSQDPVVCGRLGASVIAGVNSKGIKSVIRNFFISLDDDKYSQNVYASVREIKEKLALPFELAIKAEPMGITISPAKVNGRYLVESQRYLKDLLRRDYGFKGVTLAEKHAVTDYEKCIRAGVDTYLTTDSDIKFLEKHDERIKAFGMKRPLLPCDMDAHDLLAVKMATKSITLLKNDGTLPLKNGNIAVLGKENAQIANYVNPYYKRSFADVLRENGKSVTEVSFAEKPREIVEKIRYADYVFIWLNENTSFDVVNEIKRLGKKTIGLINDDGGRVLDDDFNGLFYVGYYGQGAKGLYRLVFGEVSPCGKLSQDFYDDKNGLLYPFGFGLSYTSFKYSNMKLSENLYKAGKKVYVSVAVANVGDKAGEEIVELFVRPPTTKGKFDRALKGFKKLSLEPKEKKTAVFELDERSLSYYDIDLNRWNLLTGIYKVELCSSSRDVKATRELQVFSSDNLLGKSFLYGDTTLEKAKDESRDLTQNSLFKELKAVNKKAYKKAVSAGKVIESDISKLDLMPLRILREINKEDLINEILK